MSRSALLCMLALASFASPCAFAGNSLATKTGNEIGLSVSDYEYTESGVSLIATKWGIDYAGTYAMDQWFLRGEIRYAQGKADYTGSGTANGKTDWYYEFRGLAGKDFSLGNHVLSPYVGLGYRHLLNDLRGLTSTNAIGYRRESNYYTLPVGANHRMNLNNNAQLFTTLEFDYLS